MHYVYNSELIKTIDDVIGAPIHSNLLAVCVLNIFFPFAVFVSVCNSLITRIDPLAAKRLLDIANEFEIAPLRKIILDADGRPTAYDLRKLQKKLYRDGVQERLFEGPK